MNKLENIDHNLTRQTREIKKKLCKQRGDQACVHNYSPHLECCDLVHDVALIVLKPLAEIIENIKGPKYEE
jgi:hypothetical protein